MQGGQHQSFVMDLKFLATTFIYLYGKVKNAWEKNVHQCDISNDSFVNAKEIIMYDLAKYYSEKLESDKLSEHVIGQCIAPKHSWTRNSKTELREL
jgi:hypothetical protein